MSIHDIVSDLVQKYGTDDPFELCRYLGVRVRITPLGSLKGLYTYIDNNKENMNYPDYKKSGLFVGSGAMESANIYMMQNRMKLQGMRWNVITGRYMLCLKSYQESHKWTCIDETLSKIN